MSKFIDGHGHLTEEGKDLFGPLRAEIRFLMTHARGAQDARAWAATIAGFVSDATSRAISEQLVRSTDE